MIDMRGKTAFLTGGARGIGKAILDGLKSADVQVVAPTRAEMDLSNPGSVQEYLRTLQQAPDIIILCAGINEMAGIEEVNLDNLSRTFQVNLFSSIQIIQHFVPEMKRKQDGKIIFVSSLYAMVSRENRISYASSKNAVTGLMKTLCLELASYNIMVNAVAPGYVETDLTYKNLTSEDIKSICSNIPTHRFQMPKEISDLILFLCSDLNRSITGQLIAVDGGFLCR